LNSTRIKENLPSTTKRNFDGKMKELLQYKLVRLKGGEDAFILKSILCLDKRYGIIST